MKKLLTLFALLFTLTGCKTLTELPEPSTTDGLTVAERKLDKITAQRLSRISASVGIASKVAKSNPSTPANEFLVNELELSKILTGEPNEEDEIYANFRSDLIATGDMEKLYKKERASAKEMVASLKEADASYEFEKAKKQAEYNAKLIERTQELEHEKNLRKIEAQEARKDKFMYLGGLILLIGVFMLYRMKFTEGLLLISSGFLISSVGFIWDSPYFSYFLGLIFLVAIAKIVWFVFIRKPLTVNGDNK
jgi:hypothetical protein